MKIDIGSKEGSSPVTVRGLGGPGERTRDGLESEDPRNLIEGRGDPARPVQPCAPTPDSVGVVTPTSPMDPVQGRKEGSRTMSVPTVSTGVK